MPQEYDKTLNLPTTEFPMRAGLPEREPKMLEQWEQSRLYYKMIEKAEGKPLYAFHDGPPYANADIHLGTALNKVLKDIIVRSKNMLGYKAAYVPGWDTHGLPIELKAIKQMGLTKNLDPVELRKACKEFALFHVENQKKQFKRLGTLADYDDPYLTLQPAFEAKQIEIFGDMAKKGYIYKDLKSVYWCPECVTALAEAEIEYSDDPCDSIYVKFQITEDKNDVLKGMGAESLENTYVLIWTTTTWTLPANLCTCLGPDFAYVLVKAGEEKYLLAKDLVENVMSAAGISDYEILGSAMGKELEFVKYVHPFLDRGCILIVGDHVTLETGTGCVHTAPGHGVEDFEVCSKHYPELGCVVPVDAEGRMTAEAGGFCTGQKTGEANKTILERIKESGHLLAVKRIAHQYPHCWRCKEPVLFRATEQWFCNVEDFKEETVEQINKVEFIPEWGRERMIGMVRDRSAWCISRQRTWGVPIPVFYCEDCGEYVVNDDTINAVKALFAEHGSDAWYTKTADEILPDGFMCPECGGRAFRKETDIMDVWFDSGTSHASVMEGHWKDQAWPCDLYLEGTDQYRGWFQSSLLTSVAWRGVAPYKTVCTHGWVVDGEGKKMSKSLGNGIDPQEIVDKYGADILRLWVASSDYHADIRLSKEILAQMSEVYRKIRNTARYILGNLSDFDPEKDWVSDNDLTELDRWALTRLDALITRAIAAYGRFDFHIIYHAVHNFCTVDMSNFYLDVLKDRLYVEAKTSVSRRAAQTTIYKILRALVPLTAPLIPFTAEEIWSYLPQDKNYDSGSVMFNDIAKPSGDADTAFAGKWERLIAVRNDINKALETERVAKRIGKSLEAKVILGCDGKLYEFLNAEKALLKEICIVSQVELERQFDVVTDGEVKALRVKVSLADGAKCERCWAFSTSVGEDASHPTLCARCAAIIA